MKKQMNIDSVITETSSAGKSDSTITYDKTSAENVSVRKLDNAVDYNKASKDDIYYMMLNSIDYYDKISGTVYFPNPGDMNIVNTVQFQSVLSETSAYSHYSQTYVSDVTNDKMESISSEVNNAKEIVWNEEYYCNGNDSISLNCLEKTYKKLSYDSIGLDAVCDIPNDERITEIDGEPCYNYRTDPTNVPEASICIFPQEMAFGFLTDQELWDIDGIEETDNKLCYHISGKTSEGYGNKLNVSEFEFMVDVNTGVLIQYIGYDENGEISDYMFTENICFEDESETVKCFSDDMLSGYKEYQ